MFTFCSSFCTSKFHGTRKVKNTTLYSCRWTSSLSFPMSAHTVVMVTSLSSVLSFLLYSAWHFQHTPHTLPFSLVFRSYTIRSDYSVLFYLIISIYVCREVEITLPVMTLQMKRWVLSKSFAFGTLKEVFLEMIWAYLRCI
jgi:hypothetical protein